MTSCKHLWCSRCTNTINQLKQENNALKELVRALQHEIRRNQYTPKRSTAFSIMSQFKKSNNVLPAKDYKSQCELIVHGYTHKMQIEIPFDIIALIFTFYFMDEFIKVFCRFRPQNSREKHENDSYVITTSIDRTKVQISHPQYTNKQFEFSFEHIFDYNTNNQAGIYQKIGPCFVESVFNGYNASFITYGPTGAGKSYTMIGMLNSPHRGLMFRIIEHIFDKINNLSNESKHIEYKLELSYIEIFMEKTKDLLDPITSSEYLRIVDTKHGVCIENITETEVNNNEDVLDLCELAGRHRSIRATCISAVCSAGNVICILKLTQKNLLNGELLVSKMKFCELEGSELRNMKQYRSSNYQKHNKMSKSLNTLQNVVYQITNGDTYIARNDSLLTRLLMDELGGNCKTFFMINASPSSFNVDETIATCKFAQRVRCIVNNAKINMFQ
eukprot:356310_1